MRTLFALLLLALPLSAAPVPKALKGRVNLDGKWLMTELQSEGKVLPQGVNETRWTIDGERVNYETSGDGKTFNSPQDATFAVVPVKGGKANEVDYVVSYHTGRVAKYPGVVEADGDTFKLCYRTAEYAVRPTECKSVNGTVMFVFKRAESK